jgi:hypothetical protein
MSAAEALIQTALLGEAVDAGPALVFVADDDLLVRGSRHGSSTLTRKDGSTVRFEYHATKTRVAGLHLFVSIGFLA